MARQTKRTHRYIALNVSVVAYRNLMPDFNTLFNSYGATIAFSLWFLYRELWPFTRDKVFSRWSKAQDDRETERAQQLHEYNAQAQEYRIFLLEELKTSRKDAKEDREQTRVVLTDLKCVIESVITQLKALTDKVSLLDTDVRDVYRVIGKDKSLIN